MMQQMKDLWAAMAIAARSEDEVAQRNKQPEEVVAVENQQNLVAKVEKTAVKYHENLVTFDCYVLLERVSIPSEEF